jgi:hypothetical protein
MSDALDYYHLVDASLPALLDKYISERLHQDQNNWPTTGKDMCNVLAVALFWHMTSQGVVLRPHPTSLDLTFFL